MSQLVIDFSAAIEAGRNASDACTAKAERSGFDTDGARAFVLGWLRQHGDTSGEELVAAARANGFTCDDARAFGSVFRVLLDRGLIVCLRSDLPRLHGHGTSGGKLYRAVPQ